jgi:hypothetical protein
MVVQVATDRFAKANLEKEEEARLTILEGLDGQSMMAFKVAILDVRQMPGSCLAVRPAILALLLTARTKNSIQKRH